MGKTPKTIQSKVRKLKPAKSAEEEAKQVHRLYLFYSFDLVNSTYYKSIDRDWNTLFSHFFDIVHEAASKQSAHIEVWKYVGDEVLLYQEVRSPEDVLLAVPFAFETMMRTQTMLHNIQELCKTVLDIRATLWAALVKKKESRGVEDASQPRAKNIMFDLAKDNGKSEIDFLGQDVDIGFRISKYGARDKLVLSANLAYLISSLMNDSELDSIDTEGVCEDVKDGLSLNVSDIRLVDYVLLKGIWNQRYYPIIWYDTRWNNINKMFAYDEKFNNPMIRDIETKSKEPPRAGINALLTKVFSDLNLTYEMDALCKHVRDLPCTTKEDSDFSISAGIPFGRDAELHCSVLCYNSNREIMIAKRAANKTRFPNIWEFGCVQLSRNKTIEDKILEGYKMDFGVKFSNPHNITPFLTYHFKTEDGRVIPGIRFIAHIQNTVPDKIQKRLGIDKHSEVRFLSKDQLDAYDGDECVEGFKEAILKAFDLIDSFF